MSSSNETNYFSVDVFGAADFGGENVIDEGNTAISRRFSEQWDTCARCGFVYPFSQLRRQPGDGGAIIVCTVIPCYDEASRNDLLPIELPTEQPLEFIPGD